MFVESAERYNLSESPSDFFAYGNNVTIFDIGDHVNFIKLDVSHLRNRIAPLFINELNVYCRV